MIGHSQDERFTIKGHWWLPESTRRVAGDLIYEVKDMTLALYGGLNDALVHDLLRAAPERSEFPIIHGESLDGVPMTVLDSFYTSWKAELRSFPVQSGTRTALGSSQLCCHAMIKGLHLASQDDAFAKCRIEIPYLDYWLGDSPFEIGVDASGGRVHIDYTRPESEQFPIDGCECVVRFVPIVRPPGLPSFSPSIEHRTDVVIETSKPMPLRWFQQHAAEVVDLFSFLYGSCILSRRLALFTSNKDGDEATLYYPRHDVKLADLGPTDIMVRYKIVKESFTEVLRRWLTASEVVKRARRVVLSSERRPSAFINFRFLPLLHAAEDLTKENEVPTIVDPQKFREVREQVLAVLPKELPDELIESIKNSLEHANGHTLRYRLSEMLDGLQNDTCDLFCVDKTKFIAGLVNARNYYTHYSARKKLLQRLELHWAIRKTSLMLRVLLLLRAGVPENDLKEAVRSSHPLRQERAVWCKITEEGSPFSEGEQ